MFDDDEYAPAMEVCTECGDSFKAGTGIAAHKRLRHGISSTESRKANDVKPVAIEKDLSVGIRKLAKNVEQPEVSDAIERRADAISDALSAVFKATDVGDSVMGKLAGEGSQFKVALIHLGITVAPILGVAFVTIVLPRVWPRRMPLIAENGEPIVNMATGEPLTYSKDGRIWLKGKVVGNLSDEQPIPAPA